MKTGSSGYSSPLLLAVCMLCSLCSYAQNLSNQGKEFWVGYGLHQFMEPPGLLPADFYNTQEMVLYFSAESKAAEVTVTINGTVYSRTYTVAANSVIASEYLPKVGANDCRMYSPPPSFGGTGGDGIFNRGIHIVSTEPIVAYAHIFGKVSSGATMLMPVETLGRTYVSINSRQKFMSNCFSLTYAIATHDNTVIEITPSVLTRGGSPAGIPFRVTLNKGQMYQVIGANPDNSESALEVSGTRFSSVANSAGECYPIAAFSGSSRTYNRISACSVEVGSVLGNTGGGDNDMQQLFPYQAWGRRYYTAPTASGTGPKVNMFNSYKVLVKDPATIVKRNGVQLTGMVNNYYYFESDKADLIESDKPIMVAQYMTGGASCTNDVNSTGDPEMIYISPIEQGIKHIGFFRNNQENIFINYLTLIVPNGGTGLSSLRIDGLPLSAIPAADIHTYPHPRSPDYTVVVRRWTGFFAPPSPPPGQCIVDGDSAFTAITYGLGGVESYGYNAGTLINNLGALSSIQNTPDPSRPEHPFTCEGTPVSISALMKYKPSRLVWMLSALDGMVSPATDVIDNAPTSASIVMVNRIPYFKYTLPGTYTFGKPGNYELSLISTNPDVDNCDQTEKLTLLIEVKEKPLSAFTFTQASDCSLDTVYLHSDAVSVNGYTNKSWNWYFPDNTQATGKDTLHVFKPGADMPVRLSVITTDGCILDTIRRITIFAPPAADFDISDAILCEPGEVVFTPSASYEGSSPLGRRWWNFGNGMVTESAAADPQRSTFRDYKTYTIKHVVKVSELCISDTAIHSITLNAKPSFDIKLPSGCLPASGVAEFINNSKAADGKAITSHSWTFGDTQAAPGSNSSSLRSPTHAYSNYGTYIVTYLAGTENGCKKDTTMQVVFDPAPRAAFSSDTDALCLGGEIRLTDKSIPGVSGITSWNWNFGDGTTSSLPSPVKTYKAAGTYNISLTVVNMSGCSSLPAPGQQVTVHSLPLISAGRSFNEKEGTVVIFESTSDKMSYTFRWSPASGLSDPEVLRPSLRITGNEIYTLTAVNEFNCKSTSSLKTGLLRPIAIPNAFSPNGDGINDRWMITYLTDYPMATIEIFNRYGQRVFYSVGYNNPWDGNTNGKPQPFGTYYYIIDLKNGTPPFKGSVTIIR